MALIVQELLTKRIIQRTPLLHSLCAVACCIVDGSPVFHPTYSEDSQAEADINLVFTHKGQPLEIQAFGEKGPMAIPSWDNFLQTGFQHAQEIIKAQNKAMTPKC